MHSLIEQAFECLQRILTATLYQNFFLMTLLHENLDSEKGRKEWARLLLFLTMEVGKKFNKLDMKERFNWANKDSLIIKITLKVIWSKKAILNSVLHIRIFGTDQCNIEPFEICITISFHVAQ